jgi:5-methylcytosine-specific restriction endonuclease McrA
MASAGVDLDSFAVDEAARAVLAADNRYRFDAALDVRAAHFLSALHLQQPEVLAEWELRWCGTHRGWMSRDHFYPDTQSTTGFQASCKYCQALRRRARYGVHRHEELAARKTWRDLPGNADADNARRSQHARSNPAQEAARKKRRAARVRDGQVIDPTAAVWFERDKRRLRERYRHRCQGCGERVPSNQALDHLIPYARGGVNSSGNLWLLCTSCNSSKSTRTWMEWRVWRRRRGLTEVAAASRRRAGTLP